MALVRPIDTPAGQRRRLALRNPATLEPLGEIEVQTADDVRAAVEAARKAQPGWAELSVQERGRYLRRALDVLIEKQDDFIDVIVSESGKPRGEARMMEIYASCDALSFYAKHAARILKPQPIKLHGMLRLAKRCRIYYQPLGVVGVISPWNAPLILSLNPAVQALMAGNAVVVKPSEVTPRSGALLDELFTDAGLPEGVLTVLWGDGETGAALVEADVDKVSFTGSVATGRKVGEACARRLIPSTLELGGKDAMIVCEDADLERAAGAALAGAFLNAGQYCSGTERVYVVDAVADEFTRHVLQRISELRQGASGEFDVGPLFWEPQLAVIERQMTDARAKGARVLAGGRRNPDLEGLFYEPTLVVDVTHDMELMREETFGPILPIMRVADVDEAVRAANDCDYGLGGSVWTRDAHAGQEISQRLETGSVSINDMSMTYGAIEAPFGGRKQSGIGQVNGEIGLRSCCFAQPVLSDRFRGRRAAAHYPYSAKADEGMRRFIRLLWGTPLGRWLS